MFSKSLTQYYFCILCLWLAPLPLLAQTYHLTYPGKSTELRNIWDQEVFKLALEKTTHDFGYYTLKSVPDMAYKRRLESLIHKRYSNFFFSTVYDGSQDEIKEVAILKFPIQLGLLGYRVCFHSPKWKRGFRTPSEVTVKALKQLTIGQGDYWTDTTILEHNGYKVVKVPSAFNFSSLFEMSKANRYELFCRGVIEMYDEYHVSKKAKGLMIEPHFAFYYPFPVFLHTNKSNKKAIQRITLGLQRAYKDGSLHRLFAEHWRDKLSFINLPNRRIVTLENPYLQKISNDYQKYNLDLRAFGPP